MTEEFEKSYQFTKEMGEISGFGGGGPEGKYYEKTCQKMVEAGAKWLDENPNANLAWKEFKNFYGITTEESEDVKKLQKVMLKAANDDCTGAMMQICLGHIAFIQKNGWAKYVEEMKKNKE